MLVSRELRDLHRGERMVNTRRAYGFKCAPSFSSLVRTTLYKFLPYYYTTQKHYRDSLFLIMTSDDPRFFYSRILHFGERKLASKLMLSSRWTHIFLDGHFLVFYSSLFNISILRREYGYFFQDIFYE